MRSASVTSRIGSVTFSLLRDTPPPCTGLGLPFVELAAEKTQVFPSKGECRKMVQAGGVSLNKEKVADPMRAIAESDLIDGKYLLVQKGKKNYYLVIAE